MTSLAEMIVRNTNQKVPIGTLLVVDELILPQDLDFALEHQRSSKELLGQILVRIGAVRAEDLDRVLKLQGSIRTQ